MPAWPHRFVCWRLDLGAIRTGPLWVLVAVLVICFAPLPIRELEPVISLHDATGGLVSRTLQVYLLELALLAPVLYLAGLRPTALGMTARNLWRALTFMAVAWAVGQVLLLALLVAQREPIHLSRQLDLATSHTIGALVAHLAGVALVEELAFRGFLLPRAYAAAGWTSRRWRLVFALAASQVIFGVSHLAVNLEEGYSGLALAALIAGQALTGVLFAWLWLITGNVFFVMVVHALNNTPMPLFDVAGHTPHFIMYALVLATVIFKPELVSRPQTIGASSGQGDSTFQESHTVSRTARC